MKKLHALLSAGFLSCLAAGPALASGFPVSVESCGRTVTFDRAPTRAISHDLNMSEMMFALGLQDHMAGLTGITGWYKMTESFKAAMGTLPELAPKTPNVEALLSVNPDFFFAGWNYGMKPGGPVTPDTLGTFGIPVYELTESCIHLDKNRPRVSMDTMYTDVLNIGKIFGRGEQAQALVDGWRERIDAVKAARVGGLAPRVFLYDSGEEKPFTAGKFAMPTAMIEAAGGRNVMDDVETSWGRVNWEMVADRNPEFIILVDYQNETHWQDLWLFLEGHPAMSVTDAVKNKRYLRLKYAEITPGPANIEAVEKLAAALKGASD